MILKNILFVFLRLWQYLSLYFLKPFDAINDTLTSSLIHRLDWDGEVVELGSGDGEFSYVMHGGTFPIWYDRYLDTDLSKNDIFDTHKDEKLTTTKVLAYPNIILSIDARENHVKKIKEIGFSKDAICSFYEKLPLEDESIEKIFYYTPHGLENHDKSIDEALRILKPKGKLLILLYDSVFKEAFLCHKYSKEIKNNFLSNYFKKLDNGRYSEITNLSRTKDEWVEYFKSKGLDVKVSHTGLSKTAWKFYDIQTRPILKPLIRLFNLPPLWLRAIIKIIWMILLYPLLLVFYFLFSNEFIKIDKNNCYFSFELEKS